MGIIGFAAFVFTLIRGTPDSDPTFVSFEVAHIVVFFMAIAFVMQAMFLTAYASLKGKTFIMALRTSTRVLITAYDNLKPVELHRFLNVSPYFPSIYPSMIHRLRSTIEFRIMERLFIAQHRLSPDFRFAHYVVKLFRLYIAELGYVSPAAWFAMACLVGVNFLRAAVVDPVTSGGWASGCPSMPAATVQSAGIVDPTDHRRRWLGSSSSAPDKGTAAINGTMSDGSGTDHSALTSSPACKAYVLIYTYVCAAFLFLYAVGIYMLTKYYVEEIIKLGLKADQIKSDKGNRDDGKGESFRLKYRQSLTLMMRREVRTAPFHHQEQPTACHNDTLFPPCAPSRWWRWPKN